MSTEYHIAVVVYQSTSDSPSYKPLYEECVTLVKASTVEQAKDKATELAKARSTTFTNQKGEKITWSLYKVIDVSPMLEDKIGDVTELYSRHFSNIDAYQSFETLTN